VKSKIQKKLLIFSLFFIINGIYGQSIYYFPQIDTLQVYSGCTEPFLNISTKNDSSLIDTISFSAGFNTGLSYTDSTGNYQYIDYYYFLINDSLNNNYYEMWYQPVESWYDSIRHQIPMDSTTIFEGYFYLILYVYENTITIDSLSQFVHAKCWGMNIDINNQKLSDFNLLQNYPNPFNSSTKITYIIPNTSHVKIDILDINGRFLRTLINEKKVSGCYTFDWDAKDLGSGIYFYRIIAGNISKAKKCLLVK